MKNKGLEFWPPKKQVMYHKKPSKNVGFWSSWYVCNTIYWHNSDIQPPEAAVHSSQLTAYANACMEKFSFCKPWLFMGIITIHTVDGSEILHQLICSWSNYLQGFYILARWCRISAINSITGFQTSKETQHNLVGSFPRRLWLSLNKMW